MHKIRAEYLGPALRRPMVLDHALASFSNDGYRATSMASLAHRAGVAKAVLYDCFPGGKVELFRALIDRCQAECRSDLDALSATTPHGLLWQLADAAAAGRPHWSLVMLPTPGSSPVVETHVGLRRRELLKRIGSRLQQVAERSSTTTAPWVVSETAILATIGIALHSEHFGVSAEDLGRTVSRMAGSLESLQAVS